MRSIHELQFDNTYARLSDIFHQRVRPTAVPNPYLVAFSPDAARLIDLHPESATTQGFLDSFSGNVDIPGADPVAMRYAGHQFGTYVPQLGDGRAILLGEAVGQGRWDLHLKGAGQTEFSRFGDGRAVLRSSIREYLACEAMHALGVPTTRALCVIGTPMLVYRETPETGALVVRMAPSHVRFGSFEVFAHRGQTEAVRQLADYVIDNHFSHLTGSGTKYVDFYREVINRTARLMAHWQAIGFAHGVMNTDNMSILGLTLDYGPYGFMEEFDPGFICNHSDHSGRYAFDQQARIGFWNVVQLGRSLLSLMAIEEAQAALETYADAFNQAMNRLMKAKLGLTTEAEGDDLLWQDLLEVMRAGKSDYTLTFRALADFRTGEGSDNHSLLEMLGSTPEATSWLEHYRSRLIAEQSDDSTRRVAMNRVNPKYVLRNYLAQVAIEKSQAGDHSEVDRLRGVLAMPFDEQPEMSHYAKPGPPWSKHLVVSCSS